jgi:hypothetical protein
LYARAELESRWRAKTKGLRIRQGIWRFSRSFRPGDPSQGWKIHVSATVLSAANIYARVSRILRQHRALFKVPADLALLGHLNSGAAGYSQIGKFITVYTRCSDEALILISKLHAATRGLSGPQIPFDVRYRTNSTVYYRYGGYTSAPNGKRGYILDFKGRPHIDKCAPRHAIPSWIRDTPLQIKPRITSRRKGPIGLEYLVRRAFAQRGKGGVFEVLDLSVFPPRIVVLKQGRRHGDTDWSGDDGANRVKREARILRRLQVAGIPVPGVLRTFRQEGNQYLVLEKLAGHPLLSQPSQQPSRPSWRRAQRILDLLGHLLSKMHSAGWVWRDCKPAHIFLHHGAIRLIDFEGACLIDETDVLPWGSASYVPPIYHGKFSRRPGTMEDDYALGVIAFQFATGEFPPLGSRRRHALFRRSSCPDFLRVQIESLLRY